MRHFASLAAAAGLFSALTFPSLAEGPPVVLASIKPIHSLVAAVMQGVAEPGLIVEGAATPHSYALKPSQAAQLSKATHVFWIGHELEAFLEKPIETIGDHATTVDLLATPGLNTLAFREGGAFEAHEDDGEEHKGEAHDGDHAEHGKDGHEQVGHEQDGHDEHHHDGLDPHVWLDPLNAVVIVREIAAVLSADDPANASRYAANAARTVAALEALTVEIAEQLAPVQGAAFIVFHDGYRYFEERFGLHAAGSITISPEITPGAERIHEIRDRVSELGASCVFAEPQFEPRLIAIVMEGSQAKAGTLDPLGAGLEDGPDLYFKLIRNMAGAMRDCLS